MDPQELEPREQRVINKLKTTPGQVLAWGTGVGKALHVDEPVFTPNGKTTIGRLKVGDKIFDESGALTTVTGVYPQGELELFKVIFHDGNYVTCCAEHLWNTQTWNDRRNFSRAKDEAKAKFSGSIRDTAEIARTLLRSKAANHSVQVCGPVQFHKKTLSVDPYLMGILLGDGHFHNDTTSFTSSDSFIVEAVRALLPNGYSLTPHKISYGIVNKLGKPNLLHRSIKEMGLRGKRAWEKFVPAEYLYSSIEDRISLLQGLIDSDGTIGDKNGAVSFTSTSSELIAGVKFIVESLGGIVTVGHKKTSYTYKGVKKQGRTAHTTYIKLANEILPCRLPRKLEKWKAKSKYLPIRYIKAVEAVGVGPAVCIAVDNESKLFLTTGFIPTHNTRGSIMAANHYGNNVSVMVPAALQDNYKKELAKWLPPEDAAKFNVTSQQKLVRNGADSMPSPDVMVVDEAHRARNSEGGLNSELKKIKSNKNIVLSASPVYNHPADIAPLVNLAAQKNVLPESRAGFTEKYIADQPVNPGLFARFMGIKPGSNPVLKNTQDLKKIFNKYVDYEQGNRAEGFPSYTEENITVPLARPQQDIYKTIMNQAPAWVRWKVRAGLPPNRQELQPLQAFLTGARQVSNSDWDFIKNKNKFIAPKAEAAANYLRDQIKQNPRYKGVVYSNYLGSGLSPYKSYMNKYKIPYGEFSGEIPQAVRNQMVRDYNENKLKALLISSAGAEGLD